MKFYGGGGRRVRGKSDADTPRRNTPRYEQDDAGLYIAEDTPSAQSSRTASERPAVQYAPEPDMSARSTPRTPASAQSAQSPSRERPSVREQSPENGASPEPSRQNVRSTAPRTPVSTHAETYAARTPAQSPARALPRMPQDAPAAQAGYRWVDDEDIVFTSSHDTSVPPPAPPRAPRAPQPPETPEAPGPQRPKKRRRLRWYWKLLIAAGVLAGLYLFAVFSPNAFVKKWRTIYIETAMSTKSHQWLATAFIPESIINDVLETRYLLDEEQADMVSDKNLVNPNGTSSLGALRGTTTAAPETTTAAPETTTAPEETTSATTVQTTTAETTTTTTERSISEWLDPTHPLYQTYPELDVSSFYRYAVQHEDTMFDSDGYLMIDEADRDGDGTEIQTVHGDTVLALDTRNGILLVRVTGDGYNGVLAIVRDASRVGLVVTAKSNCGQRIPTLCEDNNAILGINASGFVDENGTGNGGTPYGYVVSNGKVIHRAEQGNWKIIGFDYDNVLYTGSYKLLDRELRDAAEFKPLLINNGEIVVKEQDGWGINPRTALGQTSDGTVLMLVINGRSTSSLGCQSIEGARILLKYGAVQASALDGGSSSVMYYNGRVITYPSGANKTDGRQLPNAFVVFKAE